MPPILEPQDPDHAVWNSPVRSRTRDAGATHVHRYSHGREWARIPWSQESYERALDEGAMLWDLYGEMGTAFRGPDARRAVDLLVTATTSDLGPGRCRYAPIADHDGVFLAGSVIVVPSDDEWWVANGAIDFALWAKAHTVAENLDVEVTVPDIGLLGLVGARAGEVLRDLGVDAPARFGSAWSGIAGTDVVVSNTAWGGGFELYVPGAAATGAVWDAVTTAGERSGLVIADPGLASARAAEAGFDDFTVWQFPFSITVLEHSGDRFVGPTKDGFIGKLAIDAERARGIRRFVGGIVVDDAPVPDPDLGYPVIMAGVEPAGYGLEFHRSLALGRTIGFALLDTWISPGDRVTVGGADAVVTSRRILADARTFQG